jgi:tubulin--tyrosine ligase
MQNHLPNSYVIGNKKALFHTMSHYFQKRGEDPFLYLPLTFHLKNGLEDQQYYDFLKYYHKRARKIAKGENSNGYSGKQYNAWIVKPGENSNRGNGIKVCLTLDEIRAAVRTK